MDHHPASEPTFLPKAYFKGKIIPFADATISIATHALQYGTAAISGIRGIPNRENPSEALIFRLKDHALRLSRGAGFLLYDLSPETIEDAVIQFVKANQPTTSFYIRAFAYNSSLGVIPLLHFPQKDFFIYGLEMAELSTKPGANCCFSSWMRPMDASMPLRGKIAGSYISSCLARSEASERGFDEALIMNQQGKVCEGSAMNLFIVRNGRLITPSLNQDILEGITRDSLITIAQDLGIPVEERAVDKSELFIADEVFLCGTAAKITPVLKIESHTLPQSRPLTNRLQEIFTAITEGRDQNYQNWLTYISHS